MSDKLRNCIAVSVLFALGWPAHAELPDRETADSAPRITISVYNYAQVPAWIMNRAQQETTLAFRQAGIETIWVDSSASLSDPAYQMAAAGPNDPNRLFISILPRSMAKRYSQPRLAMGFALQDSNGEFARHAYVVFHQVEDNAENMNCYVPTLLALAMSHEIGHLLLGPGCHSRIGVMRATWKWASLKIAERQMLTFTAKQAIRMRAEIEKRADSAAASTTHENWAPAGPLVDSAVRTR